MGPGVSFSTTHVGITRYLYRKEKILLSATSHQTQKLRSTTDLKLQVIVVIPFRGKHMESIFMFQE